MKQFWNDRYNQSDYVYGEQPNAFLQEQLSEIVPGRLLLPGEGEGRNAVWAQKAGWKVTAIDFSDIAREKALALARRQGLPGLDYQVGDILGYAYPAHTFDAIALIFIHLDQMQRPVFHRKLVQALKPGGLMIASTINRNPKSYMMAIVGAEVIMRWLPKGTHEWKKFITPDELYVLIEKAGLSPVDRKGFVFNPVLWTWSLSARDLSVNYVTASIKPS
ncbi:MAG: bifunctional 2-polyprenyl-6-hydroxyphenol methylase/3-demethylubiquinol 3-O-methyltransferase UbiG [Alphaproteobacteria bacterium]|nr:bifunctional 2-polyprenyl-6-hydroxyphenol methylase/3-demethylubiquinol 3-O-methyltransferase UbiG [Alphaproteobacteria bacterium]